MYIQDWSASATLKLPPNGAIQIYYYYYYSLCHISKFAIVFYSPFCCRVTNIYLRSSFLLQLLKQLPRLQRLRGTTARQLPRQLLLNRAVKAARRTEPTRLVLFSPLRWSRSPSARLSSAYYSLCDPFPLPVVPPVIACTRYRMRSDVISCEARRRCDDAATPIIDGDS